MREPDFCKAKWRKSPLSYNGDCVEVAFAAGHIGVRDSKQHGTGPVLVFNEREWAAFMGAVRSGEFDSADLAI